MIRLTPHQMDALDQINAFADRRRPGFFVLHGLAGTGKTTVISEATRRHTGAMLCAPTGNAASVLTRKTGIPAKTMHSVFYRLIGEDEDDDGKRRPLFKLNHEESALAKHLVFLDEASMIDTRMAEDILHTGACVVACGDPGQLPPVRGSQYFTNSNFTLTEVHRQALDSAVLRQAYAVRAGKEYEPDGADFRVVSRAAPEDILAADVILCWTNRTRDGANRRAREIRGIFWAHPRPGELIACLKNHHARGLFNGAIYTLERPFLDGDTEMHLIVDGRSVVVQNATFRGLSSPLDPEDIEGFFDFGYAVTVHKSQGSEWDSVVLVDEYNKAHQRQQWLYTAITRAAKRMLVIR